MKLFSGIVLALLFASMLTLAFHVQPVHGGTITVPDDYPTIQEAVNAASESDTIFVKNGTYHENVVVNKTVSLIGEGKDNTILNGTTSEPIMIVEANHVKIRGFTFDGWAFRDIFINATTGVTVAENKIVFNGEGIDVENSVNTTVEDNIINGFGLDNIGIMLAYSTACSIVDNIITNAVYYGIRLWFASSNLIHQNLIRDNDYGIFFHEANLNTISENTISEIGGPGIYFESSSSNEILHNNFVNTYDQAMIYDNSVNTWDNGFEGNYWSDYNGTDSDQDGIGDTAYVIDANNTDHHPLMGMFYGFAIMWQEKTYAVNIISNSTVSDQIGHSILTISQWPNHTIIEESFGSIYFYVSGEDGTYGFCRVHIPVDLLKTTYRVLVNGTEVPYSLLPCSNSTESYLYFTYSHSIELVEITPEFPSFLILPLFFMATLLAVIAHRRKHR
jgi:parallel beta-helix repeat protein